jgi:hypothetical protein
MKKEDVPQHCSALRDTMREMCYAKGSSGKHEPVLSSGWSVKASALDITWDHLEHETEQAKQLVNSGKRSILYYYMHKRMMDLKLLSQYTGINILAAALHMRPFFYKKLSDKILMRYCSALGLQLHELKQDQISGQ